MTPPQRATPEAASLLFAAWQARGKHPTQTQLAYLTGITPALLNHMMRGRRPMTGKVARTLAPLLDVEVSQVIAA